MISRRSLVKLLGIGVIGGGGYTLGTNGGDVGQAVGDVTATLGGGANIGGGPKGKRTFTFGFLDGFKRAEWNDSGNLDIVFSDEPDMESWGLVSPMPERKVVDSGQVPQLGGVREAVIPKPVTAGEWELIGTKIVPDQGAPLGARQERSASATMSFSDRLALKDIRANEHQPRKATVVMQNTGSMPILVSGVRFSNNIPGTGSRKFEFFEEGEFMILPQDEATATSSSLPFAVPNTDSHEVPDQFEVGIYAQGGEWWFKVDSGAVSRKSTPTPSD